MPFAIPQRRDLMRFCALLSRLTGWTLDDVLGLNLDEAEQWLEAALEVDGKFARAGRH